MMDVWVLISMHHDGSGSVDVLGVYSSERAARAILEVIELAVPAKNIFIVKSKLDAVRG